MLDLSAGRGHGTPLGSKDPRLRADEQTRLQARRRCPPFLPPAPGRAAYSAHAYARGGARQYLAAWDGHRGDVMGRCAPQTGIAPCGRVVKHGLAEAPYRASARLCWMVDHGASHRGDAAKPRLRQVDSRIMLVHTPVHASWRNHVDMSCSLSQRKVLTPNDCDDVEAVRLRLAVYEELAHQHPTPVQGKFDRTTLTVWFARLESRHRAFIDARFTCLKAAA